jgi:hypothetical protein
LELVSQLISWAWFRALFHIFFFISSGQKINITIKYALQQVPVDLYFLIDYSNSMKVIKTNVATASSMLAKTLSNVTKDYRVGYGSFVDKAVGIFITSSSNLAYNFILMSNVSLTNLQIPPYSSQAHIE